MDNSLVSHDNLPSLALRPDEPLEVTDGDPRASVLVLYRDELVECGVWEVTPGTFVGENAGFGEHMYVLGGDGTVTSADGATLELHPGVAFVAPPGWRGRWHVREKVRKIYVIGRPRRGRPVSNCSSNADADWTPGNVGTARSLSACGPTVARGCQFHLERSAVLSV